MDIDYNSRCNAQLLKVMEKFHLIIQHVKKTIDLNVENSIKILDIGSSHGYNSNIQVSYIIDYIRSHMKSSKLIEVFHNDQESNSFSELFKYINNSDESYLKKFKNIYSYGKGSSFINQLLPNESCDIIISFYTLQWVGYLNQAENEIISKPLKDHFIICNKSIPNYFEFEYKHLNNIITHRYNELKLNGNLICNLLCFETDQLQKNYKKMKTIFREMANEGILSNQEVDNMFAMLLYYRKETIEKVLIEWELKGLKVKEKTHVYIDWYKENQISSPDCKYDIVFFAESILSYCGPSFKSSIKGDDTKVNEIYNLFKSRFVNYIQNNPNFNVVFGFIFLVLTKEK